MSTREAEACFTALFNVSLKRRYTFWRASMEMLRSGTCFGPANV